MKSFFEAFPSINCEGKFYNLFQMAKVERVTAPPDMRYVKIYIVLPRLVDKEIIMDMQQHIKNSLFGSRETKVILSERFELSSQYSPKNLYEAYKDSIFEELKEKKMLEYRTLLKSEISFSEDSLTYTIEDTDINRHIEADITAYLKRVFNDRCGIRCSIKPIFIEASIPVYSDDTNDFAELVTIKKHEEFLDVNTKESLTIVLEDKSKNINVCEENNNNCKQKDTEGNNSKNDNNKKHKGKNYSIKTSNPDVIFRRDFPDTFTPLSEIIGEMGEVIIRGQILALEVRHTKKEDLDLIIFTITDFTDSIQVKLFLDKEDSETLTAELSEGAFIKLRGITTIDRFNGEVIIGSVSGIKKCEPFKLSERKDTAKEKRVELHCHTRMSDMDGITPIENIIKRVKDWGMEAIAVTDHGNVLSFPDAYHYVEKLKDKGVENPPKILYGVEGYLVDDIKDIITNPGDYKLSDKYVVFDLETTGLSSAKDKIIEIGAVKVDNGKIVDRFSTFVNPGIPIPYKIEELTGINDSMVCNEETIEKILPRFLEFSEGCAFVAHNASFDTGFIKKAATEQGIEYDPTIVDTVSLSRLLLPGLNRFKLDTVAKALGVSLEHHHRAVDDAECTAEIFIQLCEMLRDKDVNKLSEIMPLAKANPEMIKKMNTYHVIILIKNEIGRVNLYRLVSYANIDYFRKRPRIPKSILGQYREGLIVGSACEAGELFRAILDGESDDEIQRLVNFYDYLEIQPVGNNLFMIEDDNYPINSEEEIRDVNRRIVKLGELYGKPVCATCDVHFLNPEDEVYRRIIFYGMKYDDADRQPPLYLRTTDEMLDEFQYLGSDKAYEVVVTNTRMIASQIDIISPVRPDKCPPHIEHSEEILTESCYAKAHEQYGDELPEIVVKRLEKELNSIISNGYAVMYVIAKKLVEKSMSDGYLVGSRGSVGSSFAAYTSGITEVNPLPPHYYCPSCKYSEFDSEITKQYAGMAGCDMPDKLCPICGKPLKKDGFDIPFETFLGFKGDKEPDIDLNFSGEYQAKAHAYTEVLFGKGHTFKAGTVGTLAEKTAFGYVKNYYEDHKQSKRNCEIDRLLKGCLGIKRTSGQHPGGIVVLPQGEEIYSFTPVQRPADNENTNIITTHFEYHAIDHNLLKLDILGHQAPTMIRMLQDLTGIDPVKDIPFDSKETMQLFKSTDVLGISPADIGGCKLGSLGIPEFGTDFAIQMLIDADPKGFSDLVRIAGLAHGTDVWIGNARDLILSGQATISTAICTRDDIMSYLISMDMDPNESFKIMEDVRKGKVAKGACKNWPQYEEDMRTHNVPEWYIESCMKIKYMFPKAHAAAYVMMSWRIAYCKIFYPLAYYAAYFSIMSDGMDYEVMCMGKDKLEHELHRLYEKGNARSDKEDKILKDARIAQEMYARGFEFLPIDLYRSKGKNFTIEDGKLRPSFMSINGLGESAALSIEQAASQGRFLSREDFRNRAKVGQSLCDMLDELGVLEGIPESNQISIFDML